jgi:hypothetical protein
MLPGANALREAHAKRVKMTHRKVWDIEESAGCGGNVSGISYAVG